MIRAMEYLGKILLLEETKFQEQYLAAFFGAGYDAVRYHSATDQRSDGLNKNAAVPQ